MATENKLRLASQYPRVSAQSGFGQMIDPIEQILSNTTSRTSGYSPMANTGAIGASNGQLANSTNDAVQNIFALLRNASTAATNRAKEAEANRTAAESNARAVAMQAKILEGQKQSALSAIKNIPGGGTSNTTGGGGNGVTPMPMPNIKAPKIPKIPNVNNQGDVKMPLVEAPKVKSRPTRDPRKPGVQN